MANIHKTDSDVPLLTRLVVLLLLLGGLILVLCSFLIPSEWVQREWVTLRELSRELGVVLMAVFGVSLIYETLLARRYITIFLEHLRKEVEKGESNAATCAALGIRRIFPRRDAYESEYPFLDLAELLVTNCDLRVVGRSIFLLMSRATAIQQALKQGARVQLCMLSPEVSPERAALGDTEISDVVAAVSVFRKKLAHWIEGAKPQGQLELRYHNVDLLDTWFLFLSPKHSFAAWDLSFGRDIRDQRIFVLDAEGSMGRDLRGRYDSIYQGAQLIYQWDGSNLIVNKLDESVQQIAKAST